MNGSLAQGDGGDEGSSGDVAVPLTDMAIHGSMKGPTLSQKRWVELKNCNEAGVDASEPLAYDHSNASKATCKSSKPLKLNQFVPPELAQQRSAWVELPDCTKPLAAGEI
jgi:hypothetical protein